jgi:hypothetical protein
MHQNFYTLYFYILTKINSINGHLPTLICLLFCNFSHFFIDFWSLLINNYLNPVLFNPEKFTMHEPVSIPISIPFSFYCSRTCLHWRCQKLKVAKNLRWTFWSPIQGDKNLRWKFWSPIQGGKNLRWKFWSPIQGGKNLRWKFLKSHSGWQKFEVEILKSHSRWKKFEVKFFKSHSRWQTFEVSKILPFA